MSAQWKTYSGVIHVHSDLSGGAPLSQIIDEARKASIDFVVLTDHQAKHENTDELVGWQENGLLVLAGEEVYCSDGHFLAFETREDVGQASSVQYGIEEVRRQMGVVVGTHYHFDNGHRPEAIPPPVPISDVDIVEIWSFTDEFLARTRGNRALQAHFKPERVVTGPPRKFVRAWDDELMLRQVPVVGSLNLHCRKEPMLEWKTFFTCDVGFRTLRTIVYCPELPKSSTRARDLIWSALRQGHSYIGNEALGPTGPFNFAYEDPEGVLYHMGETVPYVQGGHIQVQLPDEAEIVIRHNAAPLFWGMGSNIRFPVTGPGVYRIEAYRDRKVWIFSNAIRIMTDEAPSRPTTVTDFT
ncbi:hypothetical protein KQI84_00040 [bacterium]|nr:hypothetical protein [bacterium]